MTSLKLLIRVFLFWFLFILLLVVAGKLRPLFPPQVSMLAYGVLGTVGALIASAIFIKIEKKSFADYGLVWEKQTFRNFLEGLVIGTMAFSVIFSILIFGTDIHITVNESPGVDIFIYCLALIPLALMEEIGFRAYPFQKLENRFGIVVTQLIVAFAFGFYHVLNGWDVALSFYGPFVWAFVFGLATNRSAGISMATGIHAIFNILYSISGLNGKGGLLTLEFSDAEKSRIVGIGLQMVILIVALILTYKWRTRR